MVLKPIDILVTLDSNYVPQLKTALVSLRASNPNEDFRVYLLHAGISEEVLVDLAAWCDRASCRLYPIYVGEDCFENAPTSKRYPKEMYFRLLAHEFLPKDLERVIYLDPDVLVINPICPLWELDLEGNVFAAAAHGSVGDVVDKANNVRLGTSSAYFNSGVLLIDLPAARTTVCADDLFSFIREHGDALILPDQDALNALYGNRILKIHDFVWNYKANAYHSNLVLSQGEADVDWIMKNTAVLHFCGKPKPWGKRYPYRFGALYKHYKNLSERL